MRLKQLEYLLEVSKSKSLSVAAKNLYISQPALSLAIRQLEEELNIIILTRTVDGIRLTPEGVHLIPLVQKCLLDVKQIKDFASSLQKEKKLAQGAFNIYTVPIIMDTLLYKTLKKMEEAFPQLQVTPQLIASAAIASFVSKDMPFNDLFLLTNVNHNMDAVIQKLNLTKEVLFSDKMSVVVGNQSPLINKKILSAEEIFDFEQIFPYTQFQYEKNYQQFLHLKKPIKVCLRSNNIQIINEELTTNNQAVYIVHNIIAEKYLTSSDAYTVIPIKNLFCDFIALYHPNSINIEFYQVLFQFLHETRNNL